jgi:hypothetical protein
MKQKSPKNKKRTNTINMRNKQTAIPAAYKQILMIIKKAIMMIKLIIRRIIEI